MNSICYSVSKGELNSYSGNGVKLPNSPIEHKCLSFYIFGDMVKPHKNKSPLFTCRDLISTVGVTVIPVSDRAKVRGVAESEALNYIKPTGNETVVVVDYIVFDDLDGNMPAFKTLSKCFYDMISSEVNQHFGLNEDVMIYLNTNACMHIDFKPENDVLVLTK